ncbi:MAG: STAS domain-containing protein [Gammaproteobacteria bacterium]|nr:STAS domain-containing protein [Gammaproteobacteria bacterium]
MSINTQISDDGKEITIKIDGRFDFGSHHDFRDAYRGATETGTVFMLDMANTEYMDSSALGMILLLKEYSGTLGGDIKIVNANTEIKNILQIANFDKLFSVS